MSELVDEEVGTGSQKVGGVMTRRHVIEETIDERGNVSRGKRSKDAMAVEEDTISDVRPNGGKPMKESTKKLLEKLNDPDDEETEDDDDEETGGVDTDDEEVVREKKDNKETEKKPEPKKTEAKEETKEEKKEAVKDEKPSDYDEIRADRARVLEINRKLVEKVDELEKRPKQDLDERLSALDEIEKSYLDDNIGAVRKFISVVLGVKSDSKEVDEELSGLYVDLTSRELNVPLDQAPKAARDAARTRQALARDKRERKAESEAGNKKVSESSEAKQQSERSEYINSLLDTKHNDSTLRERYPLAIALAERFEAVKPEVALWKILERGVKSGDIKPSGNDLDMLDQAAKLMEEHYDNIIETALKAKPKKNTAPVETKSEAKEKSEAQSQSHGARNLKNADASVAPATPPKKKSEQKIEDRPRFKSKKEAQDWALRHLND